MIDLTEIIPDRGFGRGKCLDNDKAGIFPLTHVEWVGIRNSVGDVGFAKSIKLNWVLQPLTSCFDRIYQFIYFIG